MRNPIGEDPSVVLQRLRDAGALVAALSVPGWVAGRRYSTSAQASNATTSSAAGAGTILYAPIHVPHRVAITKIGAQVDALVSSETFRVGLYRNANALPSSLVVESVALDGGSLGIKDDTIAVALDPGWYWTAIRASHASITFRAVAATALRPMIGIGSGATNLGATPAMWTEGGSYGAFPANATAASQNAGAVPIVFLQV